MLKKSFLQNHKLQYKLPYRCMSSFAGSNSSPTESFIGNYGVDYSAINNKQKQVSKQKKLQKQYFDRKSQDTTLVYYKALNENGYHDELLSTYKRFWGLNIPYFIISSSLRREVSNAKTLRKQKLMLSEKRKIDDDYKDNENSEKTLFESAIQRIIIVCAIMSVLDFFRSNKEFMEYYLKKHVYNYSGEKLNKDYDELSFRSPHIIVDLFVMVNTAKSLIEDIITGMTGIFKNTKIKPEKDIKTRFSDVLGIDEFKEELEEIVDYLKNPKKYHDYGAEIPKGVLLTGPPGTGKTLMARALAGEAGCNFFYKSGSEFEEVFVGVGSKRVRELFDKARKEAPAIIFIDEIDALAGSRNPQQSSVMRGTINQILSEMDGFKQTENIVVIGATNVKKVIDKAILRPGRFDKVIEVSHPNCEGRTKILEYYLNKISYDKSNVNVEIQSKATFGMTGADIKNLVNLSILKAIKETRKMAIHTDFEHSLDRVLMGTGRVSFKFDEKERLMTAYHEGGHTLVNLLTKGSMPLHKVTILPRGDALGYTAFLPEKDLVSTNKLQMLAYIDTAMGGRVAEELIYGNDEISTGCSGDLSAATRYAYALMRHYGMFDDKFIIASEKDKLSDKLNYAIDSEVQSLQQKSLQRTKDLQNKNQDKLEVLAKEQMVKETMSAEEVLNLQEIPNLKKQRQD